MIESKKAGWLRDEMPSVASIIDEFREAFGVETINKGIAEMMQAGEFWCEDHVTGKSYGVPPERRGVVPVIYRSPNGLPSMLDVKVSSTRSRVRYRGKDMSMDEFVALCDARVREMRGRK